MRAAEHARLQALIQLGILDTAPTENFDRITRMASRLFDLPISAVSLTDSDRQWFKSRVGVTQDSIPRLKAPCAEVAETSTPVVINDLAQSPVYADSLLAQMGVRFYAGAPLVTRDGFCLGSMCVLGAEAREVTEAEMGALNDLAAMAMSEIELRHAFGRTDPMTGLPNAAQFADDLADLARDASDTGEAERLLVLVEVMTAEQYSQILRTRGAAYLDVMLRRAGEVLRDTVGQGKLYCVGTCDFTFLAPIGAAGAAYVRRLEDHIDTLATTGAMRWVASVAVGVAPFSLGALSATEVLRLGHGAVEEARASEARVLLYGSELDRAQRRRLRLIDDFSHALTNAGQLHLAYQPRLDLISGRCLGVEALLRWDHPELGVVGPGEFMPLVEMTDLVEAATAWVIQASLVQAAAWRRCGIELTVSINVTAANLQEPEFAAHLLEELGRHGLPATTIELELTERALIGEGRRSIAQLHQLAAAGVSLAIDDFGTGYSSLSYLQTLPCNVLKIDQSFIRDMIGDARRLALVGSIIGLSHELGYRVVAEGVETQAIADLLRVARCDEVQGYLFGRPMSASAFEAWLREHDRNVAQVSAA